MEIRTNRLALRPVRMTYLESVHAYSSDLENTRLMMFLPHESLEETERAICEAEKQWYVENPYIFPGTAFRD